MPCYPCLLTLTSSHTSSPQIDENDVNLGMDTRSGLVPYEPNLSKAVDPLWTVGTNKEPQPKQLRSIRCVDICALVRVCVCVRARVHVCARSCPCPKLTTVDCGLTCECMCTRVRSIFITCTLHV